MDFVYPHIPETLSAMAALTDPRYPQLRARLREARQARGLTQVEAAAQLGRTQQFVSQCESGDRRIDALDLADFAALYARPVGWFLDRDERTTASRGRKAEARTGRPRSR